MGNYLVFFGKSQDFTSLYYDRNGWVADFNLIIRDFSLLESKIFTVDSITNKEILARYFFTAQGKNYCLVKLYSFAQALNGARIDGSIYGVGLLGEDAIHFSEENLNLLRTAKDNFAKLSLNGVKFNKSNFKSDSDRIWEEVTRGSNGNLLDKISTFELKDKSSGGEIAMFANNLFEDAIKLTTRVSNQDRVYFSEDINHLKRTQQKWGKDRFPIYWEQNGQFVPYKEPLKSEAPLIPARDNSSKPAGGDLNEIFKLRSALNDVQYTNQGLEENLKKLNKKQRRASFLVYALSGLVLLLLMLLFFFDKIFPKQELPIQEIISAENPINQILVDSASRMEMVDFLENIAFIYSLDNDEGIEVDTTELIEKYQEITVFSSQFNFDIKNVRDKFLEQKKKIGAQVSADKDTTNANSAAENN